MAKRPQPQSLVKAVLPEGRKRAMWYVKDNGVFRSATLLEARSKLRHAGYKTAETDVAINTIRSNPFSEVKTTKNGNLKFIS